MQEITWEHFAALDLRVGTIVSVNEFPQARKPAYQLLIDLGPDLGRRASSAQLTRYAPEALLGKQVICVTNFPAKRIAGFISEVLVLGVDSLSGGVGILTCDLPTANGERVY